MIMENNKGKWYVVTMYPSNNRRVYKLKDNGDRDDNNLVLTMTEEQYKSWEKNNE